MKEISYQKQMKSNANPCHNLLKVVRDRTNIDGEQDGRRTTKQDKVNTADSAFIFLIILVGQGGEEGLAWSGLCQKDSQDYFDSEYIGFDGSPDD